jgi:hypothetical protein
MARKTVNIVDVITTANNMLANSSDEMRESREGISALLESILTNTDNYNGFKYLAYGVDVTRREYFQK